MQSEHKTVLTEVFCDILLQYAFLFGDEFSKDGLSADDSDHLKVTVSFSGERSGDIGIATSTDLCAVLTSNVLGEDPDDYKDLDENTSDALEELINVVCGQFLTAAFGEEPVINLSPPEVVRMDDAEWKKLVDDENAIGFIVEDVPALVYASVE